MGGSASKVLSSSTQGNFSGSGPAGNVLYGASRNPVVTFDNPLGGMAPKLPAGSVSAYDVDQVKLREFMASAHGAQYASLYDPRSGYQKVGDKILSSKGDVTDFMGAYQNWLSGAQQTQANWKNYASAVEANSGGQGDNTITTGAAVGQRQQLLGDLESSGNASAPNRGMGTLGKLPGSPGVVRR